MKKYLAALSLLVLGSVHASEGHNGIRFDMKREDLEKMGFACRESTFATSKGEIRCAHMDMTGRAFSKNLERYEVSFNKEGVISSISANVIDGLAPAFPDTAYAQCSARCVLPSGAR